MNAQTQNSTPRGLRPHIVLAGNCNAGKSSLLNALVEQDLSIISSKSGTTTDPVSRSCELVPFGPVVFVDTAGLDDVSELAAARLSKTRRALFSADLILQVSDGSDCTNTSGELIEKCRQMGKPIISVVTHLDMMKDARFAQDDQVSLVSCTEGSGIAELRTQIITLLTTRKRQEKTLLEDLIRPYRLILLIVPIDLEAPAGRLILPQVQTIREVLDSDAATIVVKEREVSWVLDQLKRPPDLAITDSQVVLKAAGAVPAHIPLTTFSILFSRFKGDLELFVRNARKIDALNHGSKVLITESCSHHSHCDDIGRVKIPRWLRQYTGKELNIDVHPGTFPLDLNDYDLLIHCGACMITREQMHARLAEAEHIPITNYGVAISHVHGVLDRVLKPFAQELGQNII